jgi:cytochrome c oxidase subunit II
LDEPSLERTDPSTRVRCRLLALAVIICVPLVASGCGGNGQSTLRPNSHAAHSIATLWWVMLVAAAVILGVVLVLLALALLRTRGDASPPRRVAFFGTPFVVVGGLAVPAVLLVALFVGTLIVLPKTSPAARRAVASPGSGTGGLVVVVTGRQWFWDVDYPDAHVRTANEIHLPIGQTATLEARTGDVIHSLWIPELNRKIDMIPGQANSIRVRPLRAGVYRGQCAEFCGLQHAHMSLYVVVEPAAQFRQWLAQEAQPAARPATAAVERGEQVFLSSSCVYCHTISGTNASGQVGPDLTHVASRLSLAAGTLSNGVGNLAGWILDPQHVKPGNRMPATALSGPDLQSLLSYLESLH